MNVGAIHFGKAYRVVGLDGNHVKKFCEEAVKAHPNQVADWFSADEEVDAPGETAKKALQTRFYYLTFQDAADWRGIRAGVEALFPEANPDPLTQQMRQNTLENLKRSFVGSRDQVDTLDIAPIKQGADGLILGGITAGDQRRIDLSG